MEKIAQPKKLEDVVKELPTLADLGEALRNQKWDVPIGTPVVNEEFVAKFASELVDGFLAKQRLGKQQLQKDATRLQSVSTIEVIDKLLAHKQAAGLAEISIASYKDMLKPFARQYPMLPTSPEPIEEFLTTKRGQTKVNYYSRLSALYKFASARLGTPNPMTKVAKPTFKSKEPDSLSKEQAKRLLDDIDDDRERGLVYLYLGQAFRLSEALRLNVGDIRDDIILVHGKEREEPMPLLLEVRDILLTLADGRSPSSPVFLGQRGRLGRDMVEYNIKQLFKRAEINGIKQSPHTLRHTFGTLATIAGCDSYSLSRLMRHKISSRTSMTAHYIHLNLDDLREKLERYSPLRLLNGAGQAFGKNV